MTAGYEKLTPARPFRECAAILSNGDNRNRVGEHQAPASSVSSGPRAQAPPPLRPQCIWRLAARA
jgi:hypothetical protein